MRSPAAERRRPTLLDGAAALLVAAAAVALLFFLQPEESNFLTASVVLEGETIDGEVDRKSTRLNSSHSDRSRMPSSA